MTACRFYNNETESNDCCSLIKSGYCDSNTGPSGPKPDALANCATPRLFVSLNWDCKYTHIFSFSKIFAKKLEEFINFG